MSDEEQYADELQRDANIDKIRSAVNKVNNERAVENSFNTDFGDAWECEKEL